MSSNVIPFKGKVAGVRQEEPLQCVEPITDSLWFCGECEHSLFYMLEGGGIQCVACGRLQSMAHFDLDEQTIRSSKHAGDILNIPGMRRVIRKIKESSKECRARLPEQPIDMKMP